MSAVPPFIVQQGAASIWWPTLISFKHDDGRPLLGRKIAGMSQRELRDLGLLVANGHQEAEVSVGAGTQ
jgi:hypothetical protein